MGADVLKIEPPEGDDMRQRAPLRDGQSAYFGQLNAGKKSLALDLKLPRRSPWCAAWSARPTC
jgi:crotonobetainyl-CoA:carnitine CoA-transferase CaiB-like acyl-CoA transferase